MKIIKSEEFTWDVPLADETLLDPLPKIAHMSENFCFTGHDSKRRIAYYVHIGRWIKDPEILRELLILWMPDGSVLWGQSFGRGDCSRGPAVACERLICEEPGKRVRILYSGPMQPIAPDQIVNPPGNPSVIDKVEVDLLFEGSSAMWYYPQEAHNTTWSRWHTEQLGHVKGRITHIDKSYDFDGVGYRDHSRGPRYLTEFRGHNWIQGQFPEGDSFALYQMWQMVDGRETQVLSEAIIHKDGQFVPARVIESPRLTSAAHVMGDFRLILESASGTTTFTGKPRGLAFFSYGALMSHFTPSIPTGDATFFMTNVEQPSVFMCEGRLATGHTERSYYRGEAERVYLAKSVSALYDV